MRATHGSGGLSASRSNARRCASACRSSRRDLALAAAAATLLRQCAACSPAAHAAAPPSPAPSTTACAAPLDAKLAAAFLKSVADAATSRLPGSDAPLVAADALQRERFRLQEREFRYYREAHRDTLPALPDLSDASGGLSNRAYFNFASYVAWKAAARLVPAQGSVGGGSGGAARDALVAGAGEGLLDELQPGVAAELRSMAAASGSGRAPPARVRGAVQALLARLEDGGYVCGWQVVWGEQPGDYPADWRTSQQRVVDADVGDGDGAGSGETSNIVMPNVFQIKLAAPADIEASVALRAEEDGFCGRPTAAMLTALLRAAGYGRAAECDEYFSQDAWSGPARGTAAALLLLLGDPLNQVEVPWSPTTSVQNWTLQP